VDTNNVLSGKMVLRVASKGNFAIMLTDANTIVGTGLNSKYQVFKTKNIVDSSETEQQQQKLYQQQLLMLMEH
jgi:hypothetical protein